MTYFTAHSLYAISRQYLFSILILKYNVTVPTYSQTSNVKPVETSLMTLTLLRRYFIHASLLRVRPSNVMSRI